MIKPTKRSLAQEAMLRSIAVRTEAALDLGNPLDIYALCDRLGVSVKFVDISMEGLYRRGTPPRILLSALRPLARRTFTCAHELGHHIFEHGSTIDELQDELAAGRTFQPDEFLVQSFAGFLLMPTLGVRRAFTIRGWRPATATPAQIFTIACSFGVGYSTLINHLVQHGSISSVVSGRAADILPVGKPPDYLSEAVLVGHAATKSDRQLASG